MSDLDLSFGCKRCGKFFADFEEAHDHHHLGPSGQNCNRGANSDIELEVYQRVEGSVAEEFKKKR